MYFLSLGLKGLDSSWIKLNLCRLLIAGNMKVPLIKRSHELNKGYSVCYRSNSCVRAGPEIDMKNFTNPGLIVLRQTGNRCIPSNTAGIRLWRHFHCCCCHSKLRPNAEIKGFMHQTFLMHGSRVIISELYIVSHGKHERQTGSSHVRDFLSNTSTHAHCLQYRNSDFRLTSVTQNAGAKIIYYLVLSSACHPVSCLHRQILAHTSGLPREVPCGRSYSYSDGNICPVNTTYVLAWLRNTQLKSAPGSGAHYRCVGPFVSPPAGKPHCVLFSLPLGKRAWDREWVNRIWANLVPRLFLAPWEMKEPGNEVGFEPEVLSLTPAPVVDSYFDGSQFIFLTVLCE